MISGVKTCGDTGGYCLLGSDCTTDDDFLPDPSGHCDGLKRAFIPSAPFVCCKFNRPPKNPSNKIPSGAAEPKIATVAGHASSSTGTIGKNEKWGARHTRDNNGPAAVDPSKMDSEQLEKLNQIGSVVKKIVEQLINETANSMMVVRTDETVFYDNATNADAEANAAGNGGGTGGEVGGPRISSEDGAEESRTETSAVPSPCAKSEPKVDDGQKSVTEIVPETETTEVMNESETPEPAGSAEQPYFDDEFRYEKNICQKSCKSEVTFTVDKKPMCYGTLLDDLWILTSATCASR